MRGQLIFQVFALAGHAGGPCIGILGEFDALHGTVTFYGCSGEEGAARRTEDGGYSADAVPYVIEE